MMVPMKAGPLVYEPLTSLPDLRWRPANALELAASPEALAVTVWRELIRLLPMVHLGPYMADLVATGSAVVPVPDVEDGHGPRPAMIDREGRRWLLDGSGEVA